MKRNNFFLVADKRCVSFNDSRHNAPVFSSNEKYFNKAEMSCKFIAICNLILMLIGESVSLINGI